MHHPTDRIPHTTAFVTPEHWLEQKVCEWNQILIWKGSVLGIAYTDIAYGMLQKLHMGIKGQFYESKVLKSMEVY